MKSTHILLLVLVLIYSCTQTQQYRGSKRTVITGPVSNFSEVSDHDFIEFIYEDILAGQQKIVENIDENGKFKFVIYWDYPAEFFLKYSGLLTYYVSPGDSIHFDIDSECWNVITETAADEYAFYKVSGTAEKMNNDVAKFEAMFIDSLSRWQYQDSMIRTQSPEEYKSFM